jgi:hypothetical protein
MTRTCEYCDGKEFIYSQTVGKIIRCLECNQPNISFGILFKPDPAATGEENKEDLSVCLADNFETVCELMDREEIENKF